MKSIEYIGYLQNVRKELKDAYREKGHPCEPIMTHLWYQYLDEHAKLVPVFIHEKDKNRNTLKSLRYSYREL